MKKKYNLTEVKYKRLQGMQTIMLSDAGKELYEKFGIDQHVTHDGKDYRIFYISSSDKTDLVEDFIEGFVFIKIGGDILYWDLSEAVAIESSGKTLAAVQQDGENDLYRELQKLEERWEDPIQSGKWGYQKSRQKNFTKT